MERQKDKENNPSKTTTLFGLSKNSREQKSCQDVPLKKQRTKLPMVVQSLSFQQQNISNNNKASNCFIKLETCICYL
jgi:hypothetical protein